MDITYRIDKDILYIAAEGRIDASNAAQAEEKIFDIKNANPDKHVVIDADKLEYISSAGLRVILKLRREEPICLEMSAVRNSASPRTISR